MHSLLVMIHGDVWMQKCSCHILIKYFYQKFDSMIAVIWGSPKFTIVDYVASHRKEQFLEHTSAYKTKNASIIKFQGIAVLWHMYKYSSELNI